MPTITYTPDAGSMADFIDFTEALGALVDGDDGVISNTTSNSYLLTVPFDGQEMMATVTGTGFTYMNGDTVTGGTVTGVSISMDGVHHGDIVTSIEIADLAVAIAAEDSGDTSAVERYLLSFDFNYTGTDAPDIAPSGTQIGDNVLFNPVGNDFFDLAGGDDDFFSGDGADTLLGGDGNDILDGGEGDDTIDGGTGSDTIYGGAGNDTISSGAYLSGDFGNVYGGAGNDTLNGHSAGYFHGGAGDDRLIAYETGDDDGDFMVAMYDDATSGIVANLTATSHGGLAGGNVANGFRIADGQGGVDLVSSFVGVRGSVYDDQFWIDPTYTSLYGTQVEIRPDAGNDTITFSGITSGVLSYYGGVGGPVLADLQAGTATDLDGGNFIGSDTFSDVTKFRGTQFDDVIYGAEGSDVLIRGEDGNDTIYGRGGDDYLDGDDRTGNPGVTGDDTLIGGAGADTLDGNNGIDTASYVGSSAGVNVSLATGTGTGGDAQGDTLIDIENLTGSDHNDTLTGDAGVNVINGGAGDDTIDGGIGSDQIFGGAGNDTISSGKVGAGTWVDGSFDVVFGGPGDDIINGDSAGYFRGGAGNDRLVAHDNDSGDSDSKFMVAYYDDAGSGIVANLTAAAHGGLEGGNNEDGFQIADGQGGIDLLSHFVAIGGSDFDDQFWADGSYKSMSLYENGSWLEIRPGSGNDTISFDGLQFARVSYLDMQSGVRADLEAGTATDVDPGANIIGNDTFSGQTQFRATNFDDVIFGKIGDDNLIKGEIGNDTIYGRGGDDHLDGDDRSGNPTFTGDDTLIGGAGADTLDGNNGIDTASYVGSSAGVNVSLATGTGTGGDAQGDTLIDIENLTGSDHDDVLRGDDGVNVLHGGAGNDTLNGGGGGDTIYGEAGDDTITGGAGDDFLFGNRGVDFFDPGAGADRIDGGNDFDRVWYGDSPDGVTVDLSTGTGSGGNAEGDTYAGIERITGSAHDDTLTGNEVANALKGGAGNDTIYGLDGRDTIEGQAGNDTLHGGNANDVAMGGDGDDMIYGEAGDDALYGDAGNDTIYGDAGSDTIEGGAGSDTIYGGADADTINGGAGDDFLFGNRGIDFINPGAGADQIDGGADFDRVWYGDSSSYVQVDLSTGIGKHGNAAGDTYTGIERITGSAYDDTLTGNEVANGIKGGAGNDTIYGGDGRDTIEGQAGSDTLYGGNANDTVMGGDGDDFVYGNRGADKLDGGLGNDELWGGNDADYFVFVTEGSNGFGQDIIRDFQDGADRIDVRGVHSMSDPSQVADQFSDFTVGESYLGLKIKFEGGQVIYLDTSDNHMTVADITADDFVFA